MNEPAAIDDFNIKTKLSGQDYCLVLIFVILSEATGFHNLTEFFNITLNKCLYNFLFWKIYIVIISRSGSFDKCFDKLDRFFSNIFIILKSVTDEVSWGLTDIFL